MSKSKTNSLTKTLCRGQGMARKFCLFYSDSIVHGQAKHKLLVLYYVTNTDINIVQY